MWRLVLVTTVCLAQSISAYKILVVFPIPGRSHSILGDGIIRNLVKAGHEITYITAFPLKAPPPNLHQVDLSSNIRHFPVDRVNIKDILEKEVPVNNLFKFYGIIKNLTSYTFEHENVQNLLLDRKQEFDLVIAEWFFIEIHSGFASVFNCPFIWFSSVAPHWRILQLIDEIPNPSYTVDIQSSEINPLNFFERASQLLKQMKGVMSRKFLLDPVESELYHKYFGPAAAARGRQLVPIDVAKYNASLMFGNSHVSLGEATRLPQNYKQIGGYHIDSDLQPLSEDLKKLMGNSKDGVIYFSMGSNLKSKDWPLELKRSLLRIFGELKQTVLWKFEEDFSDLPKNVYILQWAPQQTILAHPNCVLFITHGGLLSITETIHYGVPIIGVPAFADQFINVKRAVSKGFARIVDLSYNIAEDLKEAIQEMLNNPQYENKVKELSLIYHDRPVTPGQELVHWSEHVIMTRGAPHLRSPATMLSWYQKAYLDLFAVILVLVYAIIVALKSFCRKNKAKATGFSKKKK